MNPSRQGAEGRACAFSGLQLWTAGFAEQTHVKLDGNPAGRSASPTGSTVRLCQWERCCGTIDVRLFFAIRVCRFCDIYFRRIVLYDIFESMQIEIIILHVKFSSNFRIDFLLLLIQIYLFLKIVKVGWNIVLSTEKWIEIAQKLFDRTVFSIKFLW